MPLIDQATIDSLKRKNGTWSPFALFQHSTEWITQECAAVEVPTNWQQQAALRRVPIVFLAAQAMI